MISFRDVCASFFGWPVTMVGRKFIIGDRMEIDGVRGDVPDIQLLRTTLLEVNNRLGVDQPKSRVVVVPDNLSSNPRSSIPRLAMLIRAIGSICG